jgi:hypothetical protein
MLPQEKMMSAGASIGLNAAANFPRDALMASDAYPCNFIPLSAVCLPCQFPAVIPSLAENYIMRESVNNPQLTSPIQPVI